MNALDLLARACSTYDSDPEYALELFSKAMSCEDARECIQEVSSLILSDNGEDSELLSEAASKASRSMYRQKPKKRKSFT
ncbi:MAG: hypothetical protein ACRC6V_03540 [Bacteroidales bacterium]